MGNACGSGPPDPAVVQITYFKVHGRAEPLRVLLHHSNTQWTDDSVSLPGWGIRKASGNTGEMGALPIVSYQGRNMQQLGAILRSLGIEKGYYDPTNWQQARQIDWIIDTWGDLISANAGIFFSFDNAARKTERYTEVVQGKWRPFFTNLEKQLNTNNTRFIAGDRVTIADCVMWCISHCLCQNDQAPGQPIFSQEFANYPKLNEYAATIEQEFAAYAASRPQMAQ